MARNLPKMHAIEYNTLMSLMDYVKTNFSIHAPEYSLGGRIFEIKPAYAPSAPGGLTTFKKPAIILQKIYMNPNKIAMGNYIGSYHYDEENVDFDVAGVAWNSVYQINTYGNTNGECNLISDLIVEQLFPLFRKVDLVLNNYLPDVKNPVPMGIMSMVQDPEITSLAGNENQDYSDAIRIGFETIQHIIIEDELVDLSKGFKIAQQIIT